MTFCPGHCCYFYIGAVSEFRLSTVESHSLHFSALLRHWKEEQAAGNQSKHGLISVHRTHSLSYRSQTEECRKKETTEVLHFNQPEPLWHSAGPL